jgi:hypothetical protein
MAYYLFTKGIENMTKNWDEMCDEEKSFDAWFVQNNAELYKEIDSRMTDLLKTAYMQGYAAGFQSKLKYSSEEYLQK